MFFFIEYFFYIQERHINHFVQELINVIIREWLLQQLYRNPNQVEIGYMNTH